MTSAIQARLSRSERVQQNRAALLNAAATIFAERGYHAASIDDVAAAAGLTKGAVYHQFANKRELFIRAVEARFADRLAAFAAAMSASGGREMRFEAAAVDFVRSLTADVDWTLLMLEAWSAALRDDELGRRLEVVSAAFHDAVTLIVARELGDAGLDDRFRADRLAEMVIAMTHGFGIEHRLRGPAAPIDLFADMIRLLAAGIAATSADVEASAPQREP